MRRRVAAVIALVGLAVIPAVPAGAQPSHSPMLKVSVRPSVGSARSGFAISFATRPSSAAIAPGHQLYRITAGDAAGRYCQSSAVAQAAPAKPGALVHVVLSPRRASRWCAGTFRGRVWDVIIEPCPRGLACQAIVPVPRVVGEFTFRVRRG